MKKIILAPAVALAFTGLVASPVAAAESPSSSESASTQKADQQKAEKDKAEKEAAQKKADEKAEADKKAKEDAAKKKAAADKKAKEDAAKKTADKKKGDDKPKVPKKVDPKPAPSPKDDDKGAKDDDNSGDKVNPINASVQVTSGEVTAEELADEGVTVKVTGLEKGDVLTSNGQFDAQTATAKASSATLKLAYTGNAEAAAGKSLKVDIGIKRQSAKGSTTETSTETTTFNVEEDDDAVDPIDASLKVDPKKITAEDLANKKKGVTVTVSGVKKGDKLKDSLTGETDIADADGDYKLHIWYEGSAKNLEAGKVPFTVTIDREGTESKTLNGNINVVEDKTEAPAEATMKVSPKTIEAADFANDKKGVTLAVENCEPGQDVHFEVNPKGINVTAYENTVKADDEGKASVNVFGTSSNASAYVGAYTATATCGGDTMKDTFKVTEGANGGGSNGGDNGNGNSGNGNGSGDGSQLPRTGADLGGLTTGALLLLVGGAAIAVTGRKKKFGQNLMSF